MSISEFTTSADGLRISGWRSDGQGMPVLMLHGSGASKEVFARQFDSALGDIYQLVAIDLPGHGASQDAEDAEHSYGLRGMAGTTGQVIDALQLHKPAILGWSLGGHVAIEVAAERNDLAGLILTGTPPVGRGPLAALRGFHARWDALLASKAVFSDRDAERFLRLCYGETGTELFLEGIKRSDGRLRTHFLRSLMRGDGADQKRFVETSTLPIAVINGADDPNVRRSYIESLNYAAIWRGRCQRVLGAAHAPFWEQPETFNRMLHRFLQDLGELADAAPKQAAAGGRR